jgi:DNA polymerase-3 subunit chi
MSHVIFYLLPDMATASGEGPDDLWNQNICRLATDYFRRGQSVFILVTTQTHAEILDELLWQQDPDSFVPHALSHEETAAQAPVEIGLGQPKRHRQVLINVQPEIPANAGRFGTIIDFVPAEDAAKQQARERYKQYRAQGFTLETVQSVTPLN